LVMVFAEYCDQDHGRPASSDIDTGRHYYRRSESCIWRVGGNEPAVPDRVDRINLEPHNWVWSNVTWLWQLLCAHSGAPT